MGVRALLCIIAVSFLLPACAAQTDDPRRGGLFGYNPQGYERRIQDRETRLKASSDAASAEKEEQARLEASVATQEQQRGAIHIKLAQMNAELAKTRRALDETKAKDARSRSSLDDLRRRHADLSDRLNNLESRAGDPAATAESERLNADIRRLAKDAATLGSL